MNNMKKNIIKSLHMSMVFVYVNIYIINTNMNNLQKDLAGCSRLGQCLTEMYFCRLYSRRTPF